MFGDFLVDVVEAFLFIWVSFIRAAYGLLLCVVAIGIPLSIYFGGSWVILKVLGYMFPFHITFGSLSAMTLLLFIATCVFVSLYENEAGNIMFGSKNWLGDDRKSRMILEFKLK